MYMINFWHFPSVVAQQSAILLEYHFDFPASGKSIKYMWLSKMPQQNFVRTQKEQDGTTTLLNSTKSKIINPTPE